MKIFLWLSDKLLVYISVSEKSEWTKNISVKYSMIAPWWKWEIYDEMCGKVHYKFGSNLNLPSDLMKTLHSTSKILNLWKFSPHHNISVQLNAFFISKWKINYFTLYLQACKLRLQWKTELSITDREGLGKWNTTHNN